VSTKSIGFGYLLDQAKSYSGTGNIFKNHELVMSEDLTDNDLVIRQINAAHILQRLLFN